MDIDSVFVVQATSRIIEEKIIKEIKKKYGRQDVLKRNIMSCGKKDISVHVTSLREDYKLVLLLDLRACTQRYNKRRPQLWIVIFLLIHCYWENRIERTRYHTLKAR